MLVLSLICCLAIGQASGYAYGKLMFPVAQWKYFDYAYENDTARQRAIDSGEYDYRKNVIIDVDVWRDERVFVTIIRDDGVPSSLNIVTDEVGPGGPLLKPYPDWSWTKKGDCDGITSVYRVFIDECDRLWVLDTGVFGTERICPAQLLAFDLYSDELLHRVKIPDDVAINQKTGKGLLVTPVVHTTNRCRKTYVYMADVEGYGLVVYDGKNIWRLESPYFYYEPDQTNFTIQGESFELMDGILGLALSPKTKSKRLLYFKSLAGRDLHSVNIKELTYANRNNTIKYRRYKNFTPSQSAPLAMTDDGVLFYGAVKQSAIVCWNYVRPPTWYNEAVVARRSNELQFISGIKHISKIRNGYEGELWAVSNRFQKVMNQDLDFNEINFRILRGSVMYLTAGTVCQHQPYGIYYGRVQHPSRSAPPRILPVPPSFVPKEAPVNFPEAAPEINPGADPEIGVESRYAGHQGSADAETEEESADAHGESADAHGGSADAHGESADAHGESADAHGESADAHDEEDYTVDNEVDPYGYSEHGSEEQTESEEQDADASQETGSEEQTDTETDA